MNEDYRNLRTRKQNKAQFDEIDNFGHPKFPNDEEQLLTLLQASFGQSPAQN